MLGEHPLPPSLQSTRRQHRLRYSDKAIRTERTCRGCPLVRKPCNFQVYRDPPSTQTTQRPNSSVSQVNRLLRPGPTRSSVLTVKSCKATTTTTGTLLTVTRDPSTPQDKENQAYHQGIATQQNRPTSITPLNKSLVALKETAGRQRHSLSRGSPPLSPQTPMVRAQPGATIKLSNQSGLSLVTRHQATCSSKSKAPHHSAVPRPHLYGKHQPGKQGSSAFQPFDQDQENRACLHKLPNSTLRPDEIPLHRLSLSNQSLCKVTAQRDKPPKKILNPRTSALQLQTLTHSSLERFPGPSPFPVLSTTRHTRYSLG
ncbi:hypothetical protein IWQ62_005110 [Dispira parvispora]|uniref:Uncharacterized protein n=1 Tax=Dispira parvispora TaxID=1520584 RepID=A0A9W8AKM0_9FUNG|nr:hypothetical protein IWQ62_005110 [Dispira parvispora]